MTVRFLTNLLTRRHGAPRFDRLRPQVRRRLAYVCQELSEAEQEVATRLGLAQPPRLLLVDEEEAVVLTENERGQTC